MERGRVQFASDMAKKNHGIKKIIFLEGRNLEPETEGGVDFRGEGELESPSPAEFNLAGTLAGKRVADLETDDWQRLVTACLAIKRREINNLRQTARIARGRDLACGASLCWGPSI